MVRNLSTLFQDLLTLICDVKSMEDTVREMKYDCVKAPLGKLILDICNVCDHECVTSV